MNEVFDCHELPQPLVLFDGVCNLCSSSVQFILKRDKKKVFRFASLQSDLGRNILRSAGRSESDFDTLLLVNAGQIYVKSDAALRIAKQLGGFWSLLYAGIVIPRWVRDGIYAWVARNRYRWFGKKTQCWIPNQEWRDRFVA